MRIIKQATASNGLTIKVTGKNIYGEYEVRTYKQGKILHPRTYFTDDKNDALRTAAIIFESENKRAMSLID